MTFVPLGKLPVMTRDTSVLVIPLFFFAFVIGLNLLFLKRKRGFYYFSRKMFESFMASYLASDTVVFKSKYLQMYSFLNWRLTRCDFYINDKGIFVRFKGLLSKYSGVFIFYSGLDFDSLIPPYKALLINYSIRDNALILRLHRSQRATKSMFKFKLKFDSTSDLFKVEQILKRHAKIK